MDHNSIEKSREEELSRRRIYQKVFGTPEGTAVLTDLLNECGYFSVDPKFINPELMAFAHLILQRMGVNIIQNLGNYVNAIVQTATDIDVRPKQEEEET